MLREAAHRAAVVLLSKSSATVGSARWGLSGVRLGGPRAETRLHDLLKKSTNSLKEAKIALQGGRGAEENPGSFTAMHKIAQVPKKSSKLVEETHRTIL